MMRKSGPLLAVLACLAFAQPANAQLPTPDPALYVPDYGAMIAQDTFLRQALGQPGGAAREQTAKERKKKAKRKKAAPKKPTARQRATLRFAPVGEVTAKVDQFFLENFAAPGVAPEVVLADLARLRSIGAEDIRRIGWRTTDLGDVAAYGLLVGYMVVNQESRANRKGVALLRRAVVDELARTKSVRRMDDAGQQEVAELMLLRIAYYTGWRNDLVAKGEIGAAEQVTTSLQRYLRSVYGLDVSELRLGSRGFRKR